MSLFSKLETKLTNWIRRIFMADFSVVNTKIDALKAAVDKVSAQVADLKNQPPVENPETQPKLDELASTIQEQVDKLNAL